MAQRHEFACDRAIPQHQDNGSGTPVYLTECVKVRGSYVFAEIFTDFGTRPTRTFLDAVTHRIGPLLASRGSLFVGRVLCIWTNRSENFGLVLYLTRKN